MVAVTHLGHPGVGVGIPVSVASDVVKTGLPYKTNVPKISTGIGVNTSVLAAPTT